MVKRQKVLKVRKTKIQLVTKDVLYLFDIWSSEN